MARRAFALAAAVALAAASAFAGACSAADEPTPGEVCEAALQHAIDCGGQSQFGSCQYLTDHVLCAARCDLDAPCGAFVDPNDEASTVWRRCQDTCDCRAYSAYGAECGLDVSAIDCARASGMCPCPYTRTCPGVDEWRACFLANAATCMPD
jgi:hypothetical protein